MKSYRLIILATILSLVFNKCELVNTDLKECTNNCKAITFAAPGENESNTKLYGNSLNYAVIGGHSRLVTANVRLEENEDCMKMLVQETKDDSKCENFDQTA